MRHIVGLFFLGLMGLSEGAVTINWASDFQATNRQSDGVTGLDASFEFVLGTFVGITPTSENLAQWEGAWRPLGTAIYNPSPSLQRFSNSVALTSNAAPFTTTARAYIWGRNGLLPGSEWILIGKPGWKWPTANQSGPPPFPVEWEVAGATGSDVVLGSANTGSIHMQTAVADFDLSYDQWAAAKFTGGGATAPNDDFDNDGRSNFLEYALDSDPMVKDGPFQVGLNRNLEIEISRGVGRRVNWVLKKSGDLKKFTAMTEGFEVVVDEPSRLAFKITGPLTGKQFFHVEATPQS